MSLFSLEWWQIALLFLPALLNLWGIWHAFNHTFETPLERVLWMVACVFVPVLGGVAYVLDENWDFYQRVNKETVSLEPVEHKYDVATLKELIREHVELTGSPRGKEILDDFSEFLPKFKKVLPYDYDRMLRVIASVEERGLDGEQAQIEAFYAVQKNK